MNDIIINASHRIAGVRGKTAKRLANPFKGNVVWLYKRPAEGVEYGEGCSEERRNQSAEYLYGVYHRI